MKLPTRNLSLRIKVAGAVVLAVLAIDLFQLLYFPARQLKQQREALEGKVTALARFVAYDVAVGLEFDDKGSVMNALEGAGQEADYLRGAVYKRDGSLFASHNGKRGGTVSARTTLAQATKMRLQYGSDALVIHSPVKAKGGLGGTLVLEFSTRALEQERKSIMRTTWMTGVVILLGGLLLGVVLGTSIGRRLSALEDVAKQVALGNLSASIPDDSARDEIGRMTGSFKTMLDNFKELQVRAVDIAKGDLSSVTQLKGDLAEAFDRMIIAQREMVRQFADTAVQLNTAATEFRANAEQQNRGAVEQSSAVEENQRTMDTLLKSAGHIAETAQLVLQNAETTQDNSRLVADRIATLTTHTARISEILQGINEIANKSDLLALNAALEGTKAGEAGRGFSLVANQMQRLAENVMASVVDIKKLTSTIKDATRETVLATEETTKIAANNTRSARQIAMTIQQQQTGTEQVTKTMEDVARIAREAAAGSRQVFASADDLVNLSGKLQTLVERFTLDAREGESRAQA